MEPQFKTVYRLGNYTVKKVPAKWIRDNINLNLTNFGHGYMPGLRGTIPKDEIWLDEGNDPSLNPAFISNALTQIHMMQAGHTYNEALKAGDEVQRRELGKGAHMVRSPEKSNPKTKYDIVIESLGKAKDGCDIELVRQKQVIKLFDDDFTEGGHDLVYPYIPHKTYWISDEVSPTEIPATIVHETTERPLMEKGMSYHKAHEKALQAEWSFRHKDANVAQR